MLGLEVVLADGRVLKTGGRTFKRSAGLDLTHLFIGSEGTLGVVTGATLRLHPLPPPQLTVLGSFADVAGAATAAAALVAATTPTLAELMDRGVIAAIDAVRGTGFGAAVGAVLIAQLDNSATAASVAQAAMSTGGALDVAFTTEPGEARELLDIRRAAFSSLQHLGKLLIEDVCVPVSRLTEMARAVVDIGAAHRVRTCTVAHAADGNLHPVIVRDGDQASEDAAAHEIFRRAQQLGGTVSGEHGIGRLKRQWLAAEAGPVSLSVQRQLKSVLDPLSLLNPGALFADESGAFC